LIIPCSYFFLKENYINAVLVLVFSAVSDILDGIIARKYNQITKLGKVLDPIADKLTLATVVVCMGIKFQEIIVFVSVLFIKEFLMLLAGAVLLKLNIPPPAAKWYGKLGTVLFYFSAIIIIWLKAQFGIDNPAIAVTLMSITTAIMIFALFKYFIVFLDLVKNREI
jgi:cardiolipin synthase